MKTELKITDHEKDELANMSEKEARRFASETASNVAEAIREMYAEAAEKECGLSAYQKVAIKEATDRAREAHMKKELAELESKIKTNAKLMRTCAFHKLPEKDRNLLDNQQSAMKTYASLLQHRVEQCSTPEVPKEKPKFRSYWHCVVAVDTPEGEMPGGCAQPIREATRKALEKLHPKAVISVKIGGFALNQKGADEVVRLHRSLAFNITREEQRTRDGK